jgi:NhaP-type Na+/H+ or K+/H+ antiporter
MQPILFSLGSAFNAPEVDTAADLASYVVIILLGNHIHVAGILHVHRTVFN